MKQKPPHKTNETEGGEDVNSVYANTVCANSVSPVKLKPIMGIRPGVYLTVLYSIILLLIIFFLLIFPGLNNKLTAALIVKTEPQGAAIRVNDVYMGLSGSKIILPKGTYTIEAVMPGFETVKTVQEIPGRIFGSAFFPRLSKIDLNLKTADPISAFALQAADFAQWSFAGEPTVAWQVPMSLSEGAYRVGPYAENVKEELNQILLVSSRFAVTKSSLRDLLRAKILIDNKGNAPSPVSLIGSISDMLGFLSNTSPKSAQWLCTMLPQELSAIIVNSNWYKNESTSPDSGISKEPDNIASLGNYQIRRFSLLGVNFSTPAFPEQRGSLETQNLTPFYDLFPISYMISETSVTSSLFETFLNENPEWKEHKTNYVPDEIQEFPFEINENIVTGITWYAAQAFCKWLTTHLPSSLADMEVRLPTEKEWRYASLSNNRMYNPIHNQFGGWEWSADPYAPLAHMLEQRVSEKAVQAVGSPERTITGRPLSASLNQTNLSPNGYSLPADLSSPFVTFRTVIAPKADR
ncbi:MAG: SUMF1/EgtB/PvdO family nonheme iron enzyme [Treponema sp.]|nr:SUMF1/EgtB/PvdO family nonheme iron enzyme [Treponema sp.]MCL2252238.1 SUMF1/EgtB/PvdO family nonheme iron enzyme [Treponema sp.]